MNPPSVRFCVHTAALPIHTGELSRFFSCAISHPVPSMRSSLFFLFSGALHHSAIEARRKRFCNFDNVSSRIGDFFFPARVIFLFSHTPFSPLKFFSPFAVPGEIVCELPDVWVLSPPGPLNLQPLWFYFFFLFTNQAFRLEIFRLCLFLSFPPSFLPPDISFLD